MKKCLINISYNFKQKFARFYIKLYAKDNKHIQIS